MACWNFTSKQRMVQFVSDRLKQKVELSVIVEKLFQMVCPDKLDHSCNKGTDNMSCVLIAFKKKADAFIESLQQHVSSMQTKEEH